MATEEHQTESNNQSPSSTPAQNDAWADIVKASVKSALRDQSTKAEVVMHLPENDHDSEDVAALCEKTSIAVRPSTVIRIGKLRANKPRPLKAIFPTKFDARTFISKIEALKTESGTDDAIRKIRCRPCRTPEEQKRYAALAKEVHTLNESAKNSGTESYSIRQNGEVWKFEKRGDGWKRVTDWVFTSSSSSSENGASAPR